MTLEKKEQKGVGRGKLAEIKEAEKRAKKDAFVREFFEMKEILGSMRLGLGKKEGINSELMELLRPKPYIESWLPKNEKRLDYVVSKLSESDFIRYVKVLQKGLKDREKEGLELGYLKKEGGKLCPS